MKTTLVLGAASLAAAATNSSSSCHVLPSDADWPSAATWDSFNSTVGGRLIATVPIGSPCHDPTYDATACAALQADWVLGSTHYTSSSSVMQQSWANNSCDPFTNQSTPCTLGNYVSYAVNVSGPDDVASTLAFAQSNNLRLVIRNTGHDYFGRSTGAGALALWTHNLKDTAVLDWVDANYTGKALRMGAGIQVFEAVEAGNDAGVVILGGECPTVGVAGGYLQGGGHSVLSTQYGMAADNLLQYEVITAAGAHLNASRTENSDLFWALSGGGGGNYAVVLSATVKAYPSPATVGGATITLVSALMTDELFTAAVGAFNELAPAMIDLGAAISFEIAAAFFVIRPVTMLNSNASYVEQAVLGPWLAKLADLGVPVYAQNYTTLSYYEHYSLYMGPLPDGHLDAETYQFGSRLIPRSLFEEDPAALTAAMMNVTARGATSAGNVASFAGNSSDLWNSVNPVWRTTMMQLQVTLPWDDTVSFAENLEDGQSVLTDELIPLFVDLTPDSGAYLNEASFQEPEWKETFYGVNYDKLLAIKETWDPEGVFYAYKGVGSDAWDVATDGRMCKAVV